MFVRQISSVSQNLSNLLLPVSLFSWWVVGGGGTEFARCCLLGEALHP